MLIRRWKRRGQRVIDSITGQNREAKIYVETITFSGGQKISLTDGSILVIVGPNNAGKSSVLREIREYMQRGSHFGPVLKNVEIRVKGSVQAFKKQILESAFATNKYNTVRIDYTEYELEKVEKEIEIGFVRSPVVPFFMSYLSAEERLRIAYPTKRGEYFQSAPKNPMQWLELDEGAETRISDIFEQTFDARLILNTLAGEDLVLHVLRKEDERGEIASTREEAQWLASLPRLHRQGDGMRSFTGTIMSLLVHPTSSILLDEPEAFLHPPQARRLADIIATEVPGGCQVILATHNDAFVRSLLNASGERVILARIVRVGAINRVTVLDPKQLNNFWTDPLLKTSDVLSALFHDAAILCEGDSDARFYGALMDATRGQDREADFRFFHFGGKDRIASIARALRLVEIPVVVIVDIDVLSDRERFLSLFETMGGNRQEIEQDVRTIIRQVGERRGEMTAPELSVELKRVFAELENVGEVTKEIREKLGELGRITSNWGRVKHDGFRALDAQAYGRVANACKSVGLLINPEGELEGFCREISRSRKPEWLAGVLQRKLNTDSALADARAFADQIREAIRNVMQPNP